MPYCTPDIAVVQASLLAYQLLRRLSLVGKLDTLRSLLVTLMSLSLLLPPSSSRRRFLEALDLRKIGRSGILIAVTLSSQSL
jgi:hypothetical protein